MQWNRRKSQIEVMKKKSKIKNYDEKCAPLNEDGIMILSPSQHHMEVCSILEVYYTVQESIVC